jgi:hypothetical protein
MAHIPSRPIDSKLHGVLDYTTGANLMFVLPRLLGLADTRTARVLRAFGAAHATYSVFTDYELGLIRVLPYRAHLAIDQVWTAALAGAPWIFGTKDDGAKGVVTPIFLAMYEAMSLAMSDPTGDSEASDSFTRSMRRRAARAQASRTQREQREEREERFAREPERVMPEGAEAAMGARTIGVEESRYGGIGSGAGPGSHPPVGGQQW